MADVTTLVEANGIAKDVFGPDYLELRPELKILADRIPFTEQQRLGELYSVPAILSSAQGFTYAGPDEDGITLNAAVSMISKEAQVKGSQIAGKVEAGFKMLASLPAKGPKAFANGLKLLMEDQQKSAAFRLDLAILYGQVGLGVTVDSANVDTTHTVVEFTDASFAPGIWIDLSGAPVEFWDGDTLIAELTVVKIEDRVNQKVLFVGDTGEISALDAAMPDDLNVYAKGAKDGATLKEMVGIDKIITTSGQLFGIDNTQYHLWKGQEYNVGGALNFDKLTDALVGAILFGLNDKVSCLVSPRTWQDLNKDEAALRQYDASYKRDEAAKGVRSISFSIMNVDVEILSCNIVKEGEGFIIDFNDLIRVGAYELSMKAPGRGDDLFYPIPGTTKFEMVMYTDQAVFCKRPARMTKLTGITNS